MDLHEDFARSEQIPTGSERSFGIVFAAFFALLGLWPLLDSEGPRWWALAVACLFLLVAFAFPLVLTHPNRWWNALGLLLARILSPIALGILFYLVFTPTGWIIRLAGRDPLRLKADKSAASYWVPRPPRGPHDSLRNQF